MGAGRLSLDAVLGIDFGASAIRVAWVNPETGVPECIAGPHGSPVCPGIVTADAHGHLIAGEAARRRLLSDPDRTLTAPKRLLGLATRDLRYSSAFLCYRQLLRAEDDGCAPQIRLVEHDFSPAELCAAIFREVKSWAEMHLGAPVARAVITVPSAYGHAQRQATRDAARLAGFASVRLIGAEAASALAFGRLGERRAVGHCLAVCDFGASSVQASIFRLAAEPKGHSEWRMLSSAGDSLLGGMDFDAALLERVCAEIHARFGSRIAGDRAALLELRNSVLRAKHELSASAQTQVHYPLGASGMYVRRISRFEWEEAISGFVRRAVSCVTQAIRRSGLRAEQIDEVLLAGGTMRVPKLRQAVTEAFGREPAVAPALDPLSDEPRHLAALGAALAVTACASHDSKRARPANFSARCEVRESAPFSICVRHAGCGVDAAAGAERNALAEEEIIPAGSPLPASASPLCPDASQSAPQHLLDLEILETREDSEPRRAASQSRPVARIRLAPAFYSQARFLLDADGVLHLLAPDTRGNWSALEIRAGCNLPAGDIERLLSGEQRGSASLGFEESGDSALALAQREAEDALHAITNRLADPALAISKGEREWVAETCARLRISMLGPDPSPIRQHAAEVRDFLARFEPSVQFPITREHVSTR